MLQFIDVLLQLKRRQPEAVSADAEMRLSYAHFEAHWASKCAYTLYNEYSMHSRYIASFGVHDDERQY